MKYKMTEEVVGLVKERSQLTIWFTDYLEKNSDAMDELNNKHEIWKPYNINIKKYSKIENRLRVLNYVY